jgi:hypothetical protein
MAPLLLIVGILSEPPTRADLAFSRAVEESIGLPEPPEPVRGLILGLGADCYHCREIAERKLLATIADEPGELHWLWWGLARPDPEIRLRCLSVLRRLTPCPQCNGNPFCREFRAKASDTWQCRVCGRSEYMHEQSAPCSNCSGIGSVWDGTIWD